MNVTLYTAAQIINKMFENEGIDRKIEPQRLYGEAKKGKLGVEIVEDQKGKATISLESVKDLYNKYKSTSRGRVNVDDLAMKIAGMK